MKPSDIAELFSMSEADVLRIMARAVVSREAQDVIMDKFRALGKPVPGKLLKAIASVPAEKQPVLAETILDGRLKASQVERAKEAVLRGAPKEEAIRLAKAQEEKAEAYKFEGAGLAPPEQKPSARETGEVTCPKCGARAKVYWKLKQILWE
jgi:DNA-directed RNA polymerase subunit M/transcription elongation factor TFIIS